MRGVDPYKPDLHSNVQPDALSSVVEHKLQLVPDWCENTVEVSHCKAGNQLCESSTRLLL